MRRDQAHPVSPANFIAASATIRWYYRQPKNGTLRGIAEYVDALWVMVDWYADALDEAYDELGVPA